MSTVQQAAQKRVCSQVVPALLLSSVSQVGPIPFSEERRQALQGSATSALSLLGPTSAEAVLCHAASTVRRLMTEASAPSTEGLLLASALTVALLHAREEGCPVPVSIAVEIVLHRLLKDDAHQVNLHDAARASLAMVASCNQLQIHY